MKTILFYTARVFALIFAMTSTFSIVLFAQNTSNIEQALSIRSDGVSPDASAILDVQSTTQGMLVPRMTAAQRTAIATPATGLLIFDTDTSSFWFFNGISWTNLSTSEIVDADNDTKIQVEESVDDDIIRFEMAGTEYFRMTSGKLEIVNVGNSVFIGEGAGTNDDYSDNHNTFLGYHAGQANMMGSSNTANGSYALSSNTTGNNNTANGYRSLFSNTTGLSNTAIGFRAMFANTTGYYNVASGIYALTSNTTGDNNSAHGRGALFSNKTGHSNVAMGVRALNNNTTHSNLVAIGDSTLYNNGVGAVGTIEATGNTAIGSKALFSNTTGNANTANGRSALYSNTTGSFNTAIGNYSLYSNTTGDYNTASGNRSLYFNTTGEDNTANGRYALYSNVTGDDNTAIGGSALYSNTSGNSNTASGFFALHDNTTGFNNTANGKSSLTSNTTGNYNTAIGWTALFANTTGSYNTASGRSSLSNNTTGEFNTASGYSTGSLPSNNSFCTFLGYDADNTSSTSRSNSMALGRSARISADDQVRIGNSSVTSIGGYDAWTNLSDGRFKQQIREDIKGLDFILRLRPVSYQIDVQSLAVALNEDHTEEQEQELKGKNNLPDEAILKSRNEKSQIRYSGFIAQEVEQSATETGYNFSGVEIPQNQESFYGLRYGTFVVPIVKAVQEQQEMITSLQQQNAILQHKIAELENLKIELENIKTLIHSGSK